MRALPIALALAATGAALAGCPYHRQQPLPGPQSAAALFVPSGGSARHESIPAEHAAAAPAPDPISYFQGTLEEAFARRPCSGGRMPLRY